MPVPMEVESPQANHTVPQTFTAAGTADTAFADDHHITAELTRGTTTINATAVTYDDTRGVWTATFSNVAVQNDYTLTVKLFDSTNAQLDSTSINPVKVEAAPKITISAPAPGEVRPGTGVALTIDLASGHGLATVDAELFSAAGVSESHPLTPFSASFSSILTWRTSGQVGEGHYFIVTGLDSSSNVVITTSVGGIKLS